MKIEVQMAGTGKQREAVFRLHGLADDIAESDLQLMIMRDAPHYRYLSSGAWSDEETWIKPHVTVQKAGDLEARFDYQYAASLESEEQLRVAFRGRGSAYQEELVTISETVVGKESSAPYRPRPMRKIAAGGGMAVLVAAGTAWYFLSVAPPSSEAQLPSHPQTPISAPNIDQREVARKIIESRPNSAYAYEQAERLYREQHFDAAFLVYRYAAQRGEARASLALGRMYDPERFDAATSPFSKPNPDEAATWYTQVTRQTGPGTTEYLEAADALQALK